MFSPATAVGFEINAGYIERARSLLGQQATIQHVDFFQVDWQTTFAALPQPILVVGNPPWVTNSVLGTMGSTNLPTKTNLYGLRGLDAITGKSNFDISESMLVHLVSALYGRRAKLAVLCKTAVVRKVLQHYWRKGVFNPIAQAALYRIDAKQEFAAAVDACFFVAELGKAGSQTCDVFETLDATKPQSTYGECDGTLVADIQSFRLHQQFFATSPSSAHRWRSGIKHDCAKVMELIESDGGLFNGLGERVQVETELLYPMLKSSEVANGKQLRPRRWMLVPQTQVGQDTASLRDDSPQAWAYLTRHAARLNQRASSIYSKRPPFSIFGVGPYTFSRAKVAVSSLYKRIEFVSLGTYQGKPIVLDDTCYELACQSRAEANRIAQALNSPVAKQLLAALVFSDAKRPITCSILQRIDLQKLL
jgi:hypothetical protein